MTLGESLNYSREQAEEHIALFMKHVQEELGVAVAPWKSEGPTRVMSFLGLRLCNLPGNRSISLPADKQKKLLRQINSLLQSYKPGDRIDPHVIAELLGGLNFAAQVIEPGAAEKASEGQVVTIDAVYGIFNLLSGPFIALVLESEAKMTGVENRPSAIQQMDFWKVSRVAIIPLFAQGLRLTPSQQRDEDRYLEMLHSAFSHHQLYFSHTYDVTLSFQKIGTMSDADRAKPLWQRANPRFFWNRELVDVLVRVR